MPQKTRYPARLNLADFVSFVRELLIWLATQVGDPDYRTVLVNDLQAKFDAFEARFVEYKQLKIHVPELNELYTGAGDALHAGLSMLKTMLPSFFEDPDVLGEFALADPIPDDLDELYIIAQACFNHWTDVSALPEYVDVVPDFTDVEVKYNDFVAKRDEYEAKFGEMEAAQNDLIELRDAVEEQERDLFNYYRAKHPKGDDELWTETPWGTTSGGGGTSPEIGIPQNLAAVIEGENVRISWDAVDGADSYQLVHGEFPPILLEIYAGADTEFVHENPPGGTHYYNVRAKKGDSYSEYGDAVSVEITGVAPGPPQNLQLEHVAPHVKVTWESPPSTPQYFRLYIASVPTGNPPPDMPSEPDTDKLITLSVSIFAPGPGKTLYAWITSFGDGEESDPCGPESIDII